MKYIPVLTIAGSDSSGGAGIQADIKAISALGCYAASAITAVTVQNTVGVKAVVPMRPEIVAAQIRAVMDDICPEAIKIGMVGDADIIRAIAETLRPYAPKTVIVDPVMVSTSGSRLMQAEALFAMRSELLPMATLITPNLHEAEVLSGLIVTDEATCSIAGRIIALASHCPVLVKGGHFGGLCKLDRLYGADGSVLEVFSGDTVDTRNSHGTGCTLSSAIACFAARGFGLVEAIRRAKDYVPAALAAGADVEIGQGHGPVNHFFDPTKMIKQ